MATPSSSLSSMKWLLPNTIVCHCFSYLQPLDLINAGYTCHQWHIESKQESLWSVIDSKWPTLQQINDVKNAMINKMDHEYLEAWRKRPTARRPEPPSRFIFPNGTTPITCFIDDEVHPYASYNLWWARYEIQRIGRATTTTTTTAIATTSSDISLEPTGGASRWLWHMHRPLVTGVYMAHLWPIELLICLRDTLLRVHDKNHSTLDPMTLSTRRCNHRKYIIHPAQHSSD
jgi:hypothetical protein